MAIIRLLDARRGLNRKCEELFGDARIAESIYRYLCDGIEECEDAEPERKELEKITEAHEKIGYEKGYRDGYAQAVEDASELCGLNTWAGSRITKLQIVQMDERREDG